MGNYGEEKGERRKYGQAGFVKEIKGFDFRLILAQ